MEFCGNITLRIETLCPDRDLRYIEFDVFLVQRVVIEITSFAGIRTINKVRFYVYMNIYVYIYKHIYILRFLKYLVCFLKYTVKGMTKSDQTQLQSCFIRNDVIRI